MFSGGGRGMIKRDQRYEMGYVDENSFRWLQYNYRFVISLFWWQQGDNQFG